MTDLLSTPMYETTPTGDNVLQREQDVQSALAHQIDSDSVTFRVVAAPFLNSDSVVDWLTAPSRGYLEIEYEVGGQRRWVMVATWGWVNRQMRNAEAESIALQKWLSLPALVIVPDGPPHRLTAALHAVLTSPQRDAMSSPLRPQNVRCWGRCPVPGLRSPSTDVMYSQLSLAIHSP